MFNTSMDGQTDFLKPLCAADAADFKRIYDETMQMLYKIAYRIVNDEEAAEDLAHDSLIKANEKRLEFPSINDAKYWLIRVVKNASLKLKEVIVLKEYGDMNYKDIGKVVGITEGNVKVRVFRARKLLEEMLGADDVYLPN